jgi:hypothetical protein
MNQNDVDASLTWPLVHCARCGLKYEEWQLLTCKTCHRQCCISCLHRVGVPAERLGVSFELDDWYCLECYENFMAQEQQS